MIIKCLKKKSIKYLLNLMNFSCSNCIHNKLKDEIYDRNEWYCELTLILREEMDDHFCDNIKFNEYTVKSYNMRG